MPRPPRALIACIAAAAAIGPATALAASVLSDYNLIVLGNLQSSSSVEGRAFVGGNLGNGTSEYAVRLTPAAAYSTIDTLTVGGAILSGTTARVFAGDVRYGGGSAFTLQNSGQRIAITGGGFVEFQNLAAGDGQQFRAGVVDVAGMNATLQSIQAGTGAQAATAGATISLPASQPGNVVLNAGGAATGSTVVFDVQAAALFENGNVQQIQLINALGKTVLINVRGNGGADGIVWNSGANFGTGFDGNEQNVLWNFVDATSIDLTGKQFFGALLAPDAALRMQGRVDGTVAVASLLQSGQIHQPEFGGTPFGVAEIPVPAALPMLLAGLAALGAAARRRRAR